MTDKIPQILTAPVEFYMALYLDQSLSISACPPYEILLSSRHKVLDDLRDLDSDKTEVIVFGPKPVSDRFMADYNTGCHLFRL